MGPFFEVDIEGSALSASSAIIEFLRSIAFMFINLKYIYSGWLMRSWVGSSLEATNGRHFLNIMWHNVATTTLYDRNLSHVCVDSPSAARITVQNMHFLCASRVQVLVRLSKILARLCILVPEANRLKWKLPNESGIRIKL